MNKAYKVIYNETTGTYVAVSELETSLGKATQSIKTSRFTKLHGSYCQIWCMAFRPLSLLIARLPACHL